MRRLLVITLLTAGCATPPPPPLQPVETPELAEFMVRYERFSTKLGLALAADNRRLARFYLNELDETAAEVTAEVKVHDGLPIGTLTAQILAPALSGLRTSIEGGADARVSFLELINACNRCHAATEHDFIHMLPDRPEGAPFNQDFAFGKDVNVPDASEPSLGE